METVLMCPPCGQGEPREFEATPDVIVRAMVEGWTQCEPPSGEEEVTEDVG